MYISLTFDDGWRSQYDLALPVLDKYGFKATFYIATGLLYSANREFMGPSEVRHLYKLGHEIGAHTVTHPSLKFAFLWKSHEILRSKNELNRLGIQVSSFAYPYARQHLLLRNIVRRKGYENARAAGDQVHLLWNNRYAVRGFSIRRETTISNITEWIEQSGNALLVLIFHQIESGVKTDYGCTPLFLDQICKCLSGSGRSILPLTSALRRFMTP
jgi:peptidoglycan/xylan/chitin deacetylase (PgdA/CDA1 family)